MGTSTDGILAYGYDLGEEIRFKDHGEDETPDWYDEDDPLESFQKRLLTAVGFTETEWRAEGYFERKKAAEKLVVVEFDSHCSGDYPMYLLGAVIHTASRGHARDMDFTLPENADERLAWAVETLGLDVGDQKPRWLLASYWG